MNDSPEHEIVCPGCGKLIPVETDFCPHCTAPIGPTIWMDPFKRIFASGYVGRRFTSGRPGKWVMIFQLLLGICLLPIIIYTWIESAEDWSPENIGAGLYAMLFTILMIIFYFRVFKNYMRLYGKKAKPENSPEDSTQINGSTN